jgi:hypothetical protein
MTMQRLLLCRPLGGLNDMLCQIELCCRYAERFGRTVIVDTQHSKVYFRDRFSDYFDSRQVNLLLNVAPVLDRLDRLAVFPDFLAGRLSSYQVRFEYGQQQFVEDVSGLAPTFDFDIDYAEPLIVHDACGGGEYGIGALARLRLRQELSDALLERLGRIGPRYLGVHVRNTDYRARYEQTLTPDKLEPCLPILLATDNRDTVAWFRAVFGAERIFALAGLPATAGERLHHIGDPALAYQRNRDAILDLVMLALASRLYLFELEPNPHGAKYSGFSALAANLHSDESILHGLIGDAAAVLAVTNLA